MFITFIVAVVLVMYALLTNRIANYKVEKKEYELLQKKIQLDEITGLYNRTHFFELARELIDKTREEMCIVTMDVSNFKVVNELYGMNAGDKLLKELAEQLLDIGKKYEMISAVLWQTTTICVCLKKTLKELTSQRVLRPFWKIWISK